MIMMLNDFLHVIGMGTRILLLGNFDVQNQQIKDYFPEVKSNIGYAGKIHGLYQETYRGFTLKEEYKNLEDLEVASVFLTKGLNNDPSGDLCSEWQNPWLQGIFRTLAMQGHSENARALQRSCKVSKEFR